MKCRSLSVASRRLDRPDRYFVPGGSRAALVLSSSPAELLGQTEVVILNLFDSDGVPQLRPAMMESSSETVLWMSSPPDRQDASRQVAEIKKSCNICHTPIAFMAGEVGRRVSPCYQVFDLDSEDSYLRVVAFVIPPKLIIVIGNV